MTFENRIAQIEANRAKTPRATPGESPPGSVSGRGTGRHTGLGTLLLWALFLGLVWAALAWPFGALLAAFILGPIGAIFLLPWLWFTRNRRPSPERRAILDLLGSLNPFS